MSDVAAESLRADSRGRLSANRHGVGCSSMRGTGRGRGDKETQPERNYQEQVRGSEVGRVREKGIITHNKPISKGKNKNMVKREEKYQELLFTLPHLATTQLCSTSDVRPLVIS